MAHPARLALLSLAALGACGCGRSEPATASPAADASANRDPATLAGKVVLPAELAGLRRGTLTLSAWAEGEAGREGAQPYLSRTYEMDDPDWTSGEGVLSHYFGLCEADRTGDPERGLPEELEVEACFDPDGLLSTREGVERARVHARNGAKDLEIKVAPASETAQPPGSRKKGG